MGLRETIQTGVANAFATVGNLKEAITVREQTSGSYNATTGAVTRTTTGYSINAVIVSPKRMDLENPIVRITDAVALWDPQDVPALDPQIGMSVLRGTDEYTIVHVVAVGPADGGPALLWKMFLRRPSAEAA
jgi:hypothetical protein